VQCANKHRDDSERCHCQACWWFLCFLLLSMLWSNGVKEVGPNKEEVAMVYVAKER
jgi:hypothetical protein